MARGGYLQQIDLFAGVAPAALASLEACLVRKRVPPGGILVAEGEHETCAFAVISGRLKAVWRQAASVCVAGCTGGACCWPQ